MAGGPVPEKQDQLDRAGGGSIWGSLGGIALEALPALLGAIGFAGFIAVIGGAIQWTRFWAAELPADQAVRAMPRTELITVGAVSTILFTILGLAALLLVYLIDRRPDSPPRTIGLIFVLGIELASAALIIELRWWERLLLVVWAGMVAVAAYSPARKFGAWIDRVFTRRLASTAPFSGNPEEVRARAAAANARLLRAYDDWEQVLRRPDLPRVDRDRIEAEVSAAEVEREEAAAQLERVVAHEDERERRARRRGVRGRFRIAGEWLADRTRGDFIAAALFFGGGAVIFAYEESRWLLMVLAIPPVLFVALAGVARATSRFAWYGIAVFLSVPAFGGALAVADVLHTPKVQPVAVVRQSDDRALCGIYITQTDDRLYLGRVEQDGNSRRAEDRTGRVFWIPVDDVDVASIGPLQPIEPAATHARQMLDEVYADRAEESAPDVANSKTVEETKRPDGTTVTTTTERPVDTGRPLRRAPPRDHPPDACTLTDLE